MSEKLRIEYIKKRHNIVTPTDITSLIHGFLLNTSFHFLQILHTLLSILVRLLVKQLGLGLGLELGLGLGLGRKKEKKCNYFFLTE